MSDLISEMTAGGKAQQLTWCKTGPTKTVNRGASLFFVGPSPAFTVAGTGVGGTVGAWVAGAAAGVGVAAWPQAVRASAVASAAAD